MNILKLIKQLFNRFVWRTQPKPQIDYEARRAEMRKLREDNGLTDGEIGKRFGGISRERVRQILGNKGRYFRSEWTRKLIQSGMVLAHRSDLKNAPGVKKEWLKDWGNHRHIVMSGAPKIGFEFEEKASTILAQCGISNELMPNHHPFDIKTINGARIEVTVTNVDVSQFKTQDKIKYPTWAVPVRRRDMWDFLFVFIPDNGGYTYYIIPSSEFSNLKTIDARVRIPHPRMGRKPSKWHQFHKRIDLIQDYTV